ncbi:hypothetical protein BZA05DRAFT_449025 [Tricharina praecox]|uniref:uncharacterized protein n=1 Tax=Tricharina praecox TaxID=43433 RepID=UPI00221E91C6|nr:uncharacterized protein BZA05DRAFT_449025 [Tricharina praecox]KAI5842766.1 hypothetical protein BZA05DRAFT_449025 [Tricharina praecox]
MEMGKHGPDGNEKQPKATRSPLASVTNNVATPKTKPAAIALPRFGMRSGSDTLRLKKRRRSSSDAKDIDTNNPSPEGPSSRRLRLTNDTPLTPAPATDLNISTELKGGSKQLRELKQTKDSKESNEIGSKETKDSKESNESNEKESNETADLKELKETISRLSEKLMARGRNPSTGVLKQGFNTKIETERRRWSGGIVGRERNRDRDDFKTRLDAFRERLNKKVGKQRRRSEEVARAQSRRRLRLERKKMLSPSTRQSLSSHARFVDAAETETVDDRRRGKRVTPSPLALVTNAVVALGAKPAILPPRSGLGSGSDFSLSRKRRRSSSDSTGSLVEPDNRRVRFTNDPTLVPFAATAVNRARVEDSKFLRKEKLAGQESGPGTDTSKERLDATIARQRWRSEMTKDAAATNVEERGTRTSKKVYTFAAPDSPSEWSRVHAAVTRTRTRTRSASEAHTLVHADGDFPLLRPAAHAHPASERSPPGPSSLRLRAGHPKLQELKAEFELTRARGRSIVHKADVIKEDFSPRLREEIESLEVGPDRTQGLGFNDENDEDSEDDVDGEDDDDDEYDEDEEDDGDEEEHSDDEEDEWPGIGWR